jgi:5-methylcytosine-specific restriction endonuclease McrA
MLRACNGCGRTISEGKFCASCKPAVRPHGAADQARRLRVLERDRYICRYCGGRADRADHYWPRSKGGADTLDNLVAACDGCNRDKGDLTPHEFERKRRERGLIA